MNKKLSIASFIWVFLWPQIGFGGSAFIDPDVDYTHFEGRVSDKTKDIVVLKVQVHQQNPKFLRAGDEVSFYVNNRPANKLCQASVLETENFYLSLNVEDINQCWNTQHMFRRGTILHIHAPILEQRVVQAAQKRQQLIDQRQALLEQIQAVGGDLLGYFDYEQQKEQDYEDKITQLMKEKEEIKETFYKEQKDKTLNHIRLKEELASIEEALIHYRIDPTPPLSLSKTTDHHTSAPVNQR